jgi:molybdate/tungstate transport system substrate-binding protein
LPDIFISADPAVNTTLMGPHNGNYVSWYAPFARTSIAIAYNPRSRFAPDLAAAASGSKPWYQVLQEPGLRLGRTDPLLDPRGYYVLMMMQLAERYYQHPHLSQQILGDPENPAQIFAEEELVARLGAGQLDAAFFFRNEITEHHLPSIALPDAINLGDPSQNLTYASASYTNPKTGTTKKGAAIVFTITIPNTTKNRAGAIAFVSFLLSSGGQAILKQHGLLVTPRLVGDRSQVPQELQSVFPSS